MSNRFVCMQLRLMLFSLALAYSTIMPSFLDTLILANFTNPVVFPSDKEYRNSVVMANYDCKSLCPYIVLRPISSVEVAQAIMIAQIFDISLSTRGGGHGYTCQGAKAGGIMLDMRKLTGMKLHRASDGHSDHISSMTIGTGYTWGAVLKELRQVDKNLVVVHGQCTSVGVAGYSLHGGVHFGGLSELYGLASDNILGLTAVVANGSTVELTSTSCVIDGIRTSYSDECRGLFFAFRGAGSSYGVVTSLTLQLHTQPKLQSALSIISLQIDNSHQAQKYLSSYMEKIPKEVSLTFFGLDAYFKAYSFTLLFSSKKRQALFYDILALIPSSSNPIIHFIVEASWPKTDSNFTKNSSDQEYITKSKIDKRKDGNKKSAKPTDEIFEKLKLVHKNLNNENKHEKNNDAEKSVFTESAYDERFKNNFEEAKNNTEDKKEIATVRNWLLTDITWSVPSYDLVWGAGHSYGGATVIVDKQYEEITIEQSFERMKLHENKETGKCSDCVIVFHRIGEKLRNGNKTSQIDKLATVINSQKTDQDITDETYSEIKLMNENENKIENEIENENIDMKFESFNPFRQNGSLWVEMDCGHFYPQRDSWPSCSDFINESQRSLDNIIPKHHKSHYPNVPNLNTMDWQEQYYGEKGFQELHRMKKVWDPDNFFYHSQSISLDKNHETNIENNHVNIHDSNHDGDVVDSDKNNFRDIVNDSHNENDNKNKGILMNSTGIRNKRLDVHSQFSSPEGAEHSLYMNEQEKKYFDASGDFSMKNYKKIYKNERKLKRKITLKEHCVSMYDRSANRDIRNLLDVTRGSRRIFLAAQSVMKNIQNTVSRLLVKL